MRMTENRHADDLTQRQRELRRVRTEKDVSRQDLAAALGVSYRTVVRWEIESHTLNEKNHERAMRAINALPAKDEGMAIDLATVPFLDLARAC